MTELGKKHTWIHDFFIDFYSKRYLWDTVSSYTNNILSISLREKHQFKWHQHKEVSKSVRYTNIKFYSYLPLIVSCLFRKALNWAVAAAGIFWLRRVQSTAFWANRFPTWAMTNLTKNTSAVDCSNLEKPNVCDVLCWKTWFWFIIIKHYWPHLQTICRSSISFLSSSDY